MTIYIIGDKQIHCNKNDLRTSEVRVRMASLVISKLHTKQLLNVFNLLKDDPYVQVKDEEQPLTKECFSWVLSKSQCVKYGAKYDNYRSLRSLLNLIDDTYVFTVKDIRDILATRENVRSKNKASYNGYKTLL